MERDRKMRIRQRALVTFASTILISGLGTTAWAQLHDLNIGLLKVGPKKAKLKDSRPVRTGRVIVKITNEGSEMLSVADMASLNTALQFNIDPQPGPRTCTTPTLSPDFSKKTTPPFTVAPGKKIKLRYSIEFGCGPNPVDTIDWLFSVSIDHAALDGNTDEDLSDDVCPRQPSGEDKGCGKRGFNGGRIAPTVDVRDDRSSLALITSGPHTIAHTQMTLVDTTRATMVNGSYPGAPERTLVTEVWYPAIAPADDSALDLSVGPYPFVVFAHGLGSPSAGSQLLTRHLASHGYVVIAPAFPLSTFLAPGGPTTADQPDQARDVSFLIDTFLAFSAQPAHMFENSIDASKIGMMGHSNGALTTLVVTYDQNLRDARIKASMPMSPPGCIFQEGWYGAVDVPLMVLHGDRDLLVDFNDHAVKIFDRANPTKSLVQFIDGNHVGFSDAAVGIGFDDIQGCDFLPDQMTLDTQFTALITALGGAPAFVSNDGCMLEFCTSLDPTAMDPLRQLDLMLYAGTAFFESTLRDNPVATAYLANELGQVNPDIIQATE
jgi:dienelactone hydrolase